MEDFGYIYKISWYKNARVRTSHTDVYYLNAEDTLWIHDRCFAPDIVRVYYIKVKKTSNEYESAFMNSTVYRSENLEDETISMTRSQLDCELSEAYREGFKSGYETGRKHDYKKGYNDGYAKGRNHGHIEANALMEEEI